MIKSIIIALVSSILFFVHPALGEEAEQHPIQITGISKECVQTILYYILIISGS